MDIKAKLKVMDEIKAANDEHMKEWKESVENMLRGVLIKPVDRTVEIVEIPNSLDGLTEALECDYIEIAIRTVCGREFMVICDEEGRLKERQAVSAVCFSPLSRITDYFVGNILLISSKPTPDGDMVSLTEDDANYIIDNGIVTINGFKLLIYEP